MPIQTIDNLQILPGPDGEAVQVSAEIDGKHAVCVLSREEAELFKDGLCAVLNQFRSRDPVFFRGDRVRCVEFPPNRSETGYIGTVGTVSWLWASGRISVKTNGGELDCVPARWFRPVDEHVETVA